MTKRFTFIITLLLLMLLVAGPASADQPTYRRHLALVGQDNLGAESGFNAEIDIVGNLAFVGTFISLDTEVGLNVVDISDPSNPRRIGALPQIARVADVKGADLDGNGEADIAVITNEFPGTLSSSDPSGVKDLAVQLTRQGFVIVDVSTPSSPTELFFQETFGVTNPAGGVHNTFISLTSGDSPCAAQGSGSGQRVIVHLATETNNYPIYDVADTITSGGAVAPTLCSNLSLGVVNAPSTGVLPGTSPADIDPEDQLVGIHDVVVQQDPGGSGRMLAYLAYFDAGMRIVDVTDPSAPFQVGGLNYGPPAEQLQLNHYARPTPDGAIAVSCDEIGLGTPGICRVHDTSNLVGGAIPAGPFDIITNGDNAPQVGTYTIPQNNAPQNSQRSFTFTHHNFDLVSDAGEDLMFMGDYAAGVRVADFSSCRGATVSNPCEMELVSMFNIGGGPAVGTEVSQGGLDAAISFVPPRYWGAIERNGLIYGSDTVTGIWILKLVELP